MVDPDPAVAAFAAEQDERTHFVAADWGIAVPIFCFAQGRDELVSEPIWPISRPFSIGSEDSIYVVTLDPPSGLAPSVAATVATQILASPGWREVRLEERLSELRHFVVRKFVRDDRSNSSW